MGYNLRLVTHSSGNVSVLNPGCSQPQPSLKTYTNGGQLVGSALCHQYRPLVGMDKNAVVVDDLVIGYNPQNGGIVARAGNQSPWNQPLRLSRTCGQSPTLYYHQTYAAAAGADGFLYVVSYEFSCTSYFFVTKVRPNDGQVIYTKSLGNNDISYFSAYDAGLLCTASTSLHYLDYEAAEIAQPVAIEPPGDTPLWAADAQGILYLAARNWASNYWHPGNPCGNSGSYLLSVSAYSPTGRLNLHQAQGCQQVSGLTARPYGEAIVTYFYRSPIGVLPSNGGSYQELTPPTASAGQQFHAVYTGGASADINGRIVLQRQYILSPANTGGIQTLFLDGNGRNVSAVLNSHTLEPGTSHAFTSERSMAAAAGTMYLAYYTNIAPKLYKVSMGVATMDYPRAALAGLTPPLRNKSYAALGDSFSSGEGIEPFDPASGDCHRSLLGYPRLLDQTSGSRLALTRFAACSGALSADISTDPGKQLENLGLGTDVVTASIGGNDVLFKEFVTSCLFGDCTNPPPGYDPNDKLPSLKSTLKDTYLRILAAAPSAETVNVLGYPQLLPDPAVQACTKTNGWMYVFDGLVKSALAERFNPAPGNPATAALYAIALRNGIPPSWVEDLISSGTVEFSETEVSTARAIVVSLNSQVREAVSEVNAEQSITTLKFLDPQQPISPSDPGFIGHELCTPDPHFNGLDAMHSEYSFHPNASGAQTYHRTVIASW